jgi:uncharacterized protein
MDDIKIHSLDLDGEDITVFMGFPGSGLVGSIALAHIVDVLEFSHIGNITSKYFPAMAMMVNGVINAPVRIYRKDSYVIVISDVPIHPMICYEISNGLLDWLEPFSIKEVVVIAGIVTNEAEKRVFGVAGDSQSLDRIKDKAEILPMGSITGIAGSLLVECKVNGISSFGLLGETVNNPDPRAAASVIKILNQIYGFDLDVEPLMDQATEIEAALQQMAEQVEQAEQTPVKKEQLPMYG